jgi:hypothetical protein
VRQRVLDDRASDKAVSTENQDLHDRSTYRPDPVD